MVLNMAQTWHMVRPGEVRTDCGGCHAHSQKPTLFQDTAARPDYPIFDLTKQTPLLTSKAKDESGSRWDADDTMGLRFERGVKNVEYFRDVKPIFERSCVACHTRKTGKTAGNFVLDDDKPMQGPGSLGGLVAGPPKKVPGTFFRLVLDHSGKFGHPSPVGVWSHPQASRYIRLFSARRSLLMWKVFGKRLDGWDNDHFAVPTDPSDPHSLQYKGKPLANKPENHRLINLGYSGSIMPPPKAVAEGKVAPLTDEDRRTLARWIDLGCPIDFNADPAQPMARGSSWLQDDNRPTLTLTYPRAGANPPLTRLLVGMHDYHTGLDMDTFRVIADFPVDGIAAGENLVKKFWPKSPGVWELKLSQPLARLAKGKIDVSIKDRQGNISCIERTFSISAQR
jgi:hypothetical protein